MPKTPITLFLHKKRQTILNKYWITNNTKNTKMPKYHKTLKQYKIPNDKNATYQNTRNDKKYKIPK